MQALIEYDAEEDVSEEYQHNCEGIKLFFLGREQVVQPHVLDDGLKRWPFAEEEP